MKKRIKYRQCTLRKRLPANRQGGTRSIVQVAYIPDSFARLNKSVRLQGNDGDWTDHWMVEDVGAPIWSDDLPDSHSAIKSHRRTTGDTLPRNRK